MNIQANLRLDQCHLDRTSCRSKLSTFKFYNPLFFLDFKLISKIKYIFLILIFSLMWSGCRSKSHLDIQESSSTPSSPSKTDAYKSYRPISKSSNLPYSQNSLFLESLPLNHVKESGKQLMKLPLGLHLLKTSAKTSPPLGSPLFILVHGYESRGYEWIYALHKLSEIGSVFFYRWDWTHCPQKAVQDLLQITKDLTRSVEKYPKTHSLTLFGHSYGGVLTALLSRNYRGNMLLEAHAIAAPLNGHPTLEKRCSISIKDQLLTAIPSQNTTLIQWRTLHHLDGAFKSLPNDPQIITLSGRGTVHRLPEKYKGHRLGHNWSISSVVDTWSDLRISPQK